MAGPIRPRFVLALPIANIAIPTTLILLILVVGGLLTGGLLLVLVYLVRNYVWDRERLGR